MQKLISDPCSSPMMFTDPKWYENPPKMCRKRAKTAGLSENQPKKLFLQNSPTEMGKIQEMYCHICQDIISSLPQTALSRVEILLSNGVRGLCHRCYRGDPGERLDGIDGFSPGELYRGIFRGTLVDQTLKAKDVCGLVWIPSSTDADLCKKKVNQIWKLCP